MADQVRKARYCYVVVPNRPGRGAALLAALAEARVNLVAFSGFPGGGGKAQLDFVADDLGAVRRVLQRQGLRPRAVKRCFVVTGDDRIGAVGHHLGRLAEAKISVTAADAVAAGRNRYGMILWVKPKDYARAARVLKAR
ncbi:MAG TPA: hypothetical protein VGA02_01265 [Gemmatimonadales bacterium]|jgi:hypothetical protein